MAESGCSHDVDDAAEDCSPPDAELLVNGHLDDTQLHRKLSLLTPLPTKHLALYLGDEDHPGRALSRDAISPSPRQDERRRAEETTRSTMVGVSTARPRVNRLPYDQYVGRLLCIGPSVSRTASDHDDQGRRPTRREIPRRRAEEKSGEALAELADCYRGILVGIGEDPTRHGLRETPERAARAMLYFTKGYDEKIEGMLA